MTMLALRFAIIAGTRENGADHCSGCSGFGLTVYEKRTDTMCMPIPHAHADKMPMHVCRRTELKASGHMRVSWRRRHRNRTPIGRNRPKEVRGVYACNKYNENLYDRPNVHLTLTV